MTDIFRIETGRTSLSWSEDSQAEHAELTQPTGRLAISAPNQIRKNIKIWRSDLPAEVASNPAVEVGPPLYEETQYSLLLFSNTKRPIQLKHRDPGILQTPNSSIDGRVLHYTIDFKDQIGRSRFSVCVDGETEYDFEVEVFSTKLDYAANCKILLADVQEILTGLVLEYLRSTYHLGFTTDADNPTRLEWILLLRHVVDDLERGLRYVEKQPHHGLIRESISTRVEKLKRADASVAKMVRQGRGQGPKTRTPSGLVLHSKLLERRARTTLDTPEHRWLAFQLTRIRRILAEIRSEESKSDPLQDVRQSRVSEELENLEDRIAKLRRLNPLAQAKGLPPPGFTSLTLQARPGYREAYRACLALVQGLSVDGGPVQLVLKDTRHLYEYWCYLALLRLLARITGEQIPVQELLTVQKNGLRVRLRRGTTQTVKFSNGDRSLELTYNPHYEDRVFLFPYPDVALTFHDAQGPTLRLAFVAKYRIDPTATYVNHFGSPGPPDAEINALYRYRESMLQQTPSRRTGSKTRKQMVKCVALFPYADLEDRFHNSQWWLSLEKIGIGAIPFLPTETRYLEEWLRTLLQSAGWSTVEKRIPNVSVEQERAWQQAEKEPVLIATLRPVANEHLAWIKLQRCHFTPMERTQSRQLATRWIAIYSPASILTPGAITHLAEVENFELKERREIQAPWPPERKAGEMQVVYKLREVRELERPIENRGPKELNKYFANDRWTTRLGIMEAREMREVLMETSAEWRLYGELRRARAHFTLKPGAARQQDQNDLNGRPWFVRPRLQVQYRDAAGFLIRRAGLRDEYLSDVNEVVQRFISAAS